MKKFYFAITIANLIITSLFWLRFSAPMLEATSTFFPPTDSYVSFLAAQANHYSLIQLYLVIFSIGLAVIAFWGYTEIKRSAERAVSKAITESMPGQIQKHLNSFASEHLAQISVGHKMEKPAQKSTKDVFHENIPQLLDGLED